MTCCTSLTAQQKDCAGYSRSSGRAFFEPRHCNGLSEKIDGNLRTRLQSSQFAVSEGQLWKKGHFRAQRLQNYCECRDEMFLVLTCPFKWLMYAWSECPLHIGLPKGYRHWIRLRGRRQRNASGFPVTWHQSKASVSNGDDSMTSETSNITCQMYA